jgi:hypothetical protein
LPIFFKNPLLNENKWIYFYDNVTNDTIAVYFVRKKNSDAPHYPLSNDINLAVCSLGTLNPSEQFSICSTISFLLIYKTRPNDFDLLIL